MTPEQLSILMGFVDTGAVIIVLIWVVSKMSSGQLISRAMHDEILEVYREEAKGITEKVDSTLVDLVEEQKKARTRDTRFRRQWRKQCALFNEGLARIEVAITNGKQ